MYQGGSLDYTSTAQSRNSRRPLDHSAAPWHNSWTCEIDCTASFLFGGRHHCRRCGRSVCLEHFARPLCTFCASLTRRADPSNSSASNRTANARQPPSQSPCASLSRQTAAVSDTTAGRGSAIPSSLRVHRTVDLDGAAPRGQEAQASWAVADTDLTKWLAGELQSSWLATVRQSCLAPVSFLPSTPLQPSTPSFTTDLPPDAPHLSRIHPATFSCTRRCPR